MRTYQEIMDVMLEQVATDVDKEQGSVIWDALSPCAIEMAKMYIELEDIYKLAFVKTSEGQHLTDLCFQFGIYRLPATKSIRACSLNIPVEIGTRFSVENSKLNFVLTASNRLECETPGSDGNKVEGRLLPIDYLEGFKNSFIGEVVILGEDEELDESLRQRTIIHITRPEQDGNIDQYIKWASEFVGIGNTTVMPLWNGANTVKVIITDAEGNTATQELVNSFQQYLDPLANGRGEGKAPIGAFVTVESATAQHININITVERVSIYTIESVIESVTKVVNEYLKEATRERFYKKYEVMKRVDDLDCVNMVIALQGEDLLPLNGDSVFTLGTVEVLENV